MDKQESQESVPETSRQETDDTNQDDKPGGFFFSNGTVALPSSTPGPPTSIETPGQKSLFDFKFTSFILPTNVTNANMLNITNQNLSLDRVNSNAAVGDFGINSINSGDGRVQPGQSSSGLPTAAVASCEAASMAPGGSSSTATSDDAQNKGGFHLDTSRIQTTVLKDQSSELAALGLDVFNAEQFEQGVMAQVDQHIAAEEKERRDKILKKELQSVTEDINTVKVELMNIDKVIGMLKPKPGEMNKDIQRKMEAVNRQKDNKLKQLKKLKAKQKSLKRKIHGNQDNLDDDDALFDEGDTFALEQALGLTGQGETEQERMIRTGEMTPFGTVVKKPEKPKPSIRASTSEPTEFEKFLMGQDSKLEKKAPTKSRKSSSTESVKMRKHQSEPNLKKFGRLAKLEAEEIAREKKLMDIAKGRKIERKRKSSSERETSPKRRKSADDDDRKRKRNFFDAKDGRSYRTEADFSNWQSGRARYPKLKHEWTGDGEVDFDAAEGSEEEYRPSNDWMDQSDGDWSSDGAPVPSKRMRKTKKKVSTLPKEFHGSDSEVEEEKEEEEEGPSLAEIRRQYNKSSRHHKDDGDECSYEKRLSKFQKEELKKKREKIIAGEDADSEVSDCEFDGGFKVPPQIWNKLYRYQKTCVRWLWELHCQDAGGIVGDEMGLGKTIQMIAFLTGLRVSKLRDRNAGYVGCGPVIIICPTTVMHQWVKEFHTWWPPFRIAVLHSSGSFTSSEAELVRDIIKKQGVLVTSYGSMLIHQDTILKYNWHYVVLDEGHKIRNPDAQITLACKQFRTPHRFILSGSPLQNNLKELWSLFDFVFPGKLSTLPEFMTHFSVPISQGAYSNATQVQVQTAYKCACVLRDTINPYLLRRMKADVQSNLQLPNKSEQVLFCRLTEEQKEVYKEYLDSRECQQILSGNFMVFPGLITLRKICNHPDLSTGGPKNFDFDKKFDDSDPSTQIGYWKRSGKMIVVKSLLKIWKQQGQRVLLFSQSKQMLDIFEAFVQREGYSYMRMDGGTPIGSRQSMINHYNETPSIFLFILTTRVGGLGVNLTGANRVIIFDPDWNPSTDTQARERAWRIGQTRQVTIYRLLTTGTIEEKIYHRQIFKQFLANRVLKDPKQRRFFKSNDLYELFTLGSENNRHGTETHAIFAGTGSNVDVKPVMVKKEGGKQSEERKNVTNRFDLMRAREPQIKEEVDSDNEGESVSDIKQSVKGKYKSAGSGRASPEDDVGKTAEDGKQKERNGAEADDDGEYDDDDMPKMTSGKLAWMRELAKKLSQKISKGKSGASDTGSRDSPKPSSSTGDAGKSHSNSVSPKPSGSKEPSQTDERGVKNGHHKLGGPSGDHKQRSRSHSGKESEGSQSGSKKHREQKEREHRKKKKRKHRDAEFEGVKIDHLARHGEWKTEKDEDQEEKNKEQDDFVLASLFKKSGVHSAMKHDVILDSSNPDYALVEGEADRVAKEAAKALKVSKSLLKGAARSGVPTWTGQSGQIGQPKQPKPRFGQKKNSLVLPSTTPEKTDKAKEQTTNTEKLFNGEYSGLTKSATFSSSPKKNSFSSGQLLQRMQARNYGTKSGGESDSDGDESTNPILPAVVTEHTQLITDMRNFIAFQASNSSHATTRELLDEFGHRLPPQDSAKFKAMLHQICTFEKQNNIGVWSLKPEFR